jgi:hypothetical protein
VKYIFGNKARFFEKSYDLPFEAVNWYKGKPNKRAIRAQLAFHGVVMQGDGRLVTALRPLERFHFKKCSKAQARAHTGHECSPQKHHLRLFHFHVVN